MLKIYDSFFFFNNYQDCIRAIDSTYIPAMIIGRDRSNDRNRHVTISQNVLVAYNFIWNSCMCLVIGRDLPIIQKC